MKEKILSDVISSIKLFNLDSEIRLVPFDLVLIKYQKITNPILRKFLKKGEYLFKEGEKIQSVFIVQSGQINLCLQKNKKIVDIMSVGVGYVFADLVIQGLPNYNYSALIMSETKVVEVPIANFKQQFESLHQVNKTFVKGLAEKLKWTMNEVKSARFERDPSACPDDAVPKVFGTIFHVMNHKGLKEGASAKMDWQTLRQYSQRIFGESLKRLEQATQLFKEALALGRHVLMIEFRQFAEQLFLFLGKILGGLHDQKDVQIAASAAGAEDGHPLAADADRFARLHPGADEARERLAIQ